MLSLVSLLVVLVCALISVGWLTLVERLVLGGAQIRSGAAKVGLMGVIQPLLDGIKLIVKQLILPVGSSKLWLLLPGMVTFVMGATLLYLIPGNCWYSPLSCMGLFMMLSVSSLPLFVAGMVTNSQYANLGSMRIVILTLSYEVVMFPLLVVTFHLYSFLGITSMPVSSVLILISLLWLCCVIEANRAPFDLAEGESELISGYHIEHGSMGFTFLFLAEYLGMVAFSFLLSTLLVNASLLMSSLLLLSWLLLRASLPRVKMDQLLMLCWVHLVPLASLLIILMWW